MDGFSAFMGAVALFIVITIALLSYGSGRSGIAANCSLGGIFTFQDKVFTCQERKP